MSISAQKAVILAVCALTLALLSFPCVSAALTTTQVINTFTSVHAQKAAAKVSVGISAAFPLILSDSTTLEVTKVSGMQADDLLSDKVESMIGNNVLCAMGPGSDEDIKDILSSESLESENIVFFSPFAQSTSSRNWSDRMYFTSPPPTAELLGLFSFVVRHFTKIEVFGYMYTQGTDFGEVELSLLEEQLSVLQMPEPVIFAADSVNRNINEDTFAAFVAKKPQVIFVFGSSDSPSTIEFFKKAAMDETLIKTGTRFLFPFSLMNDILIEYQALYTASLTPAQPSPLTTPAKLFFSTTNPLANDKARFPTVTAAFNSAIDALPPAESDLLTTNADRTLAFAGWIGAQVMHQAANLHAYGGREQFAKGIFQQSRYVIHNDLIIGDYGGKCEGAASTAQGMVCLCNQGGRTIYVSKGIQREAKVDIISIPTGVYTYPIDKCEPQLTMALPIYSIAFLINDLPSFAYTYSHYATTIVDVVNNYHNKHPVSIVTVEGDEDEAQTRLDLLAVSYNYDVVFGPIPPSVTNIKDALLVDPMYKEVTVWDKNDHILYLLPTLEQEAFMHAVYGKMYQMPFYVLVRNEEDAEEIKERIKRRSGTFDVTISDVSIVRNDTQELLSNLKPNAANFIMNLNLDEPAPILQYLADNGACVIGVAFDDVTKLYDKWMEELVKINTATPASTVADRLIFATNMPLWTNTKTPQSTAQADFLNTVRVSKLYSPGAMRGYMTSRFVEELGRGVDAVSPSALLNSLHSRREIAIDDMLFGPYTPLCTQSGESDCGQNYGARNVSVSSFRRVLDDSTDELVDGNTTPVPPPGPGTNGGNGHKDKSSSGFPWWLILLIILCILLLLLLLLLLLWCCCCRTSGSEMDNTYAPKEASREVTIIFTDIESSTALWSCIPHIMSKAVARHHSIIRDVIRRHQCYEVKTIGDSFMIATHDPYAAVLLSADIQTSLMKANWETDEIDLNYKRLKQEAGIREVSDRKYPKLWNGLRVRIGMHTGVPDIRFEEVTKRYDYYGDSVNIAARTEALGSGGQVILTQDTWGALIQEQQNSVEVKELGSHYLRGVPEEMDFFELVLPYPRTFPMIVTTAPDFMLPKSPMSQTPTELRRVLRSGSVDNYIYPAKVEENEAIATEIFNAYYAPYPQDKKQKLLGDACRYFCIAEPNRKDYQNDDEMFDATVNLLAERTMMIVEYRRNELERRMQEAAEAQQVDENGFTAGYVFPVSLAGSVAGYRASMSQYHPGDRRSARLLSTNTIFSQSSSPKFRRVFVPEGTVECGNSQSQLDDKQQIPLHLTSKIRGSASPNIESCNSLTEVSTTLITDTKTHRSKKPNNADHTNPLQTPAEDAAALMEEDGNDDDVDDGHTAMLNYINGRPTFAGDRVVRCFDESNGLLFRITCSRTHQWVYYNDTPKYNMYVKFSFGQHNTFEPAEGVSMDVNPENNRYEGTLFVPPLATVFLGKGILNGYKLKYTAKPIRSDGTTRVTFTDKE